MRERERDRSLERALIFNFAIHGIAMAAMGLLLLPTMPGGTNVDDAARVGAIAAHPWLFRLGWLPWQLCAVADLWLAIAMVRVAWLPRLPAVLTLLFTVAAVVPDQWAQAVWVTRGIELAELAAQSGDRAAYLALEKEIFPLTAGVGALLYTIAALGWTWCFAAAGTWSRTLTYLSITTWATMAVAVVGPLLPPAMRPSPGFVSTANGLGFMQLQVWLGLVAEKVLHRARPFEGYGRLAKWRHPSPGIVPRLTELFANSRLASAFLEPLPEAEMRSDITNVVYVNYVVPAEKARVLVPPGLELQTLGPDGKYALFTFLSFQHGNFGFRFFGPLRKWMPSPVQTNWRLHVRNPKTKHEGIYFLTNAVSNTMQALAARLTTEGMPMHVLGSRSKVYRTGDGGMRVELDAGEGSAPDAVIDLRPSAKDPELTGPWKECWTDFRSFLAYCLPQDRAMSSQPLRGRISRQEIDLGIRADQCEPLEGTVVSRAAKAIVGDAEPICFRVPALHFRFTVEHHDHES